MKLTIEINSNAIDKVMYILSNIPDIKILNKEDLSFLEKEIDKGMSSDISNKSHKEIIEALK